MNEMLTKIMGSPVNLRIIFNNVNAINLINVNHGINVNGKLVMEYLNNKPVNREEYKKLQYV